MKDEALKLALKALELSSVTVDSFGVQRKTQEAITAIKQALAAPVQEPVAWRYDLAKYRENDLRGRQWAHSVFSPTKPYIDEMVRNVTPLYTTPPAQPAPVQSCFCPNCEAMGKELAALKAQPHATDLTHDRWDEWQDKYGLILERDALDDLCTMLAAQPAPVQEPVAIALNTGTKQGVKWLKNVEHGESLYTTPPAAQQQWTGLTEDEIEECASYGYRYDVVAVTEAKLKEKNT
jgi:hypothetical protein